MNYPYRILQKVSHPARYGGSEWNIRVKDWDRTKVKVVISYPDVYEIGMSNLAIPILYDILNKIPDVLCERVFAPWVDMELELRKNAIPLCSLESHHVLSDFSIIGFSLGYELTYTNVINMLDLAQIPVFSSQRNDNHPLIIAGGVCALNPEPMADFIDLFVIGEGEEVLPELIELYSNCKKDNADRKSILKKAAHIRGIYVPSLYEVQCNADGTICNFRATENGLDDVIERRIVVNLPSIPDNPVVPYIQVVHDRAGIEVQRGCTRGCRFCQPGMIYRPLRWRSPENIINSIDGLMKNCGYDEVSLICLNTGDYPHIEQVTTTLIQQHRDKHLVLSLPSLRLDSVPEKLMDILKQYNKRDFTFAPEAGSERLCRVINKNLTDEQIENTLIEAFKRGWSNIKLYFMIGLPTETEDDIKGIVELVRKINHLKQSGSKRAKIKLTVSTFVPKPHTPFQWSTQDTAEQLRKKQDIINSGIHNLGIKAAWSDTNVSLLETVLARGDRRIGMVIYHAWKLGSTFDAWSECFNFNNWLQAFQKSGLDSSFYTTRERSLDEMLPWSHIDTGVRLEFLKQEYSLALNSEETSDCRTGQCHNCGIQHNNIHCPVLEKR
jgi:radical SAM family uncharacterized protein